MFHLDGPCWVSEKNMFAVFCEVFYERCIIGRLKVGGGWHEVIRKLSKVRDHPRGGLSPRRFGASGGEDSLFVVSVVDGYPPSGGPVSRLRAGGV